MIADYITDIEPSLFSIGFRTHRTLIGFKSNYHPLLSLYYIVFLMCTITKLARRFVFYSTTSFLSSFCRVRPLYSFIILSVDDVTLFPITPFLTSSPFLFPLIPLALILLPVLLLIFPPFPHCPYVIDKYSLLAVPLSLILILSLLCSLSLICPLLIILHVIVDSLIFLSDR